jgi:hypothetical protein
MNLPYCKFFPRDWLGDAQLRLCSLAARGLWADMLCLMGSNETRRGYLEVGGKSITDPGTLARLVGADVGEVSKLIAELEAAGVPSRDASGTIFSRRIVKDAAVLEQKRAAGKQGGNPALLKRVLKQPVKDEVKPVLESCLTPYSRIQNPDLAEREPGESVERPSLEEVKTEAQRIGLAEWKAVDWWSEMEGCGWLDHQKRPVIKWQPILSRVRTKWEADGRPMQPPSRNQGQQHPQQPAGTPAKPTVWQLKQQIEAVDTQIAEVRNRGHEDAFGFHAKTPADRALLKTLNQRKSALNTQLASLNT